MHPVRTALRYIDPVWKTRDAAPRIGDRQSRHENTSLYPVEIDDARTSSDEFGLDISGFELVTAAPMTCGTDRGAISREHEPAMLRLVREHTGARAAYLLHHLVRTEDQSNFNTAYSRFVHCDFNQRSMPQMTTRLLARHQVDPDPSWSYAWINTWQPFDHPIEQNSLAVLDARSLAPDDLIDYRYTGYDDEEGGLVAAPVHNPDHRWLWYSFMQLDEVLLTKQLEGRSGRVTQCPHSAFDLPEAQTDAAPRRSVEMRILAVFD